MSTGLHSLSQLDDDVLIHICRSLTVPSTLALRRASKRLLAITKLLIVWRNLFHTCVFWRGYPFPIEALHATDAKTLEYYTRRAYQVASFWHSAPSIPPRYCGQFNTFTKGTGISGIRFLPGREAQEIITVSKGIWSVISCWDLGIERGPSGSTSRVSPKKVAEWSPRRVILTGFAVNTNSLADGLLAVGLDRGGIHSIEILALRPSTEYEGDYEGFPFAFECIQVIETNCKPIIFEGSIIVISDDARETHIIDWTKTESAVLQRPPSRDGPDFQYNKCLQVLLTEDHVFVARAHGVEIFPRPVLLPLPLDPSRIVRPDIEFSFGWIDGVSISPQIDSTSRSRNPPPLSIILRSDMDDPWSSTTSKVELFVLRSNPHYIHLSTESTSNETQSILPPVQHNLPYCLPPTRLLSIPHTSNSSPQALRCPTILSGKCGTSLWIQPPRLARSRRDVGLTAFDVHSSQTQGIGDVQPFTGHGGAFAGDDDAETETLVGGLFPGPLRSGHRGYSGAHGADAEEEFAHDGDCGVKMLCTPFTGGPGDDAGMGSRSWTAMDYVEEWGRIVLGSSDGMVTFVEL